MGRTPWKSMHHIYTGKKPSPTEALSAIPVPDSGPRQSNPLMAVVSIDAIPYALSGEGYLSMFVSC